MNEKKKHQAPVVDDTTVDRRTENLAVLFVDISDSTKLYNTLGDNAARVVVSSCLTVICEIVARFNGRVLKTIGDEVMCVFARPDDAVAAACEMQTAIEGKRFSRYYVQIHIGLNYGSVLIEGNDVFGDTVNTAAYLRGVAHAGQILTTEATERQLSPELRASMRSVFSAVLKGNTEPSRVYQILWDTNSSDLTNFRAKVAQANFTSLVVSCEDFSCRLSKDRPLLVFGRGYDCDVRIEDTQASRKHVSIKFNRDHFYLVDHSLNGTFVTLEGGEEVRILRSEMLLERSGCFTLGRGIHEGKTSIVLFSLDSQLLRQV